MPNFTRTRLVLGFAVSETRAIWTQIRMATFAWAAVARYAVAEMRKPKNG